MLDNRLLLDVGNSRIKWAWLESSGALVEHGAVSTCEGSLADLPELHGADVWVSSVASAAFNQALITVIKQQKSAVFNVAVQKNSFGIECGYEHVARLGVDRWMAIVAAYKAGVPTLVVDCGTATTIDAIDPDGRHLGGVILPGQDLMIRTLLQQTGQIEWRQSQADQWLGKSTEAAVTSGAKLGTVYAIEGILSEFTLQYSNKSVNCKLTGQAGKSLQKELSSEWLFESDLVLQGVARFALEHY